MALVALIVSAFAMFAAGLSAWYTRRQAEEAAGVRKIEVARRQAELAPQITARIDTINAGACHRLWLALDSPRPLDQLEVTLAEGQTSYFPSGQYGVAPGGAAPLHAVYAGAGPLLPLRQGQRHCWRIEFPDARDPELVFTVMSVGPDDAGQRCTWSQLVRLPTPPVCRWEETPTKGSRPVHGAGCLCELRTTQLDAAVAAISPRLP
jgi:hypothetical protein